MDHLETHKILYLKHSRYSGDLGRDWKASSGQNSILKQFNPEYLRRFVFKDSFVDQAAVGKKAETVP